MLLDGLPSSSRSTFSLIATYQGYRFNAPPPVFSTPHFAHLSSIIFRTKLSTGLARRLVVTRGSWSLHTPRVTPTRVCLQITCPLNTKLIFFQDESNPICKSENFGILPCIRWVRLCNRQWRPHSLFITLLSSIRIVVGTHSTQMITEENVFIYLMMSKVIRERKTGHLFIVLIDLINLRHLSFEIIFSL